VEALEQMDVLGFLGGEVEQSPDLIIVLAQLGARVVEQEGEDKLFDDAENAQILVRADLVEDALLVGRQRLQRRRARQALGHEVASEVELLGDAQHIVELPGALQRRRKRRLIIEIVIHRSPPWSLVSIE
jgi:hypothetical protein